jgi:predicted nucleic acid-binding protein
MILYLDTSALVKRYFREPHTDTVIKKWRQASEIVTSSVAYTEALAAFCRKQRESDFNNTLSRQSGLNGNREFEIDFHCRAAEWVDRV